MNDHASNPPSQPNPADAELPAELRSVAAAIDRLAMTDRLAPDPAFEHRVAEATRRGAANEVSLDALGRVHQFSAPASLEDRIFMATRALLPDEPAESEPASPPIRIHARMQRWSVRVAAAITLVATAGISYIAMQPTQSLAPGTSGPGTEVALLQEDDFAGLANILSVALGNTDSENASAASEGLESTDFDLPTFDFLNNDMEGSL